jgi:hypothetical protein
VTHGGRLQDTVTGSRAWSRGFQKKKIVYFFCKRLVKRAFGKTIRVYLCSSVVEKMAENQGNQTEIRPPQTKFLFFEMWRVVGGWSFGFFAICHFS